MYVHDAMTQSGELEGAQRLGVMANRVAEHFGRGEWLEAAADVGRLESWASSQLGVRYTSDVVRPWCASLMEILEEASGLAGEAG
jgi:hypothetical protein